MPIHDWTRVGANRFHDFHQRWSIEISNVLNDGALPTGFFAMVEQITGGPEPDVVALELTPPRDEVVGGRSVVTPPVATVVTRSQVLRYADRGNRVVVRHPDGAVVAVIEIVSPGNKSSRDAIRTFARKAVAFLRAGIHLLVIDLFPPSRRDPQGIHKVIWDRIADVPFELPADKPLTLAAYEVSTEITGYIEPVAVGDVLPDMPVFLTAGLHVPCPLEAAYQTAWDKFPVVLRGPLLED